MFRTKSIVLLSLLALFFLVGAVQAQTPSPSTDLLFAAVRAEPMGGILVRMDTKTWTTTPFYVDTELLIGGVLPLRWSPDGQSLAILRSVIPDRNDLSTQYLQVCVLSHTGTLIRCMDEPPQLVEYGYVEMAGDNQIHSLTWSGDSTKLYFVAADAEREMLRFVEAEVATGRTLRVLSEHVGAQLVWSPALDYRVQVSREWVQPTGAERLSVEHQRLSPALQAAGRSELSAQFLAGGHFDRLCPETSPRGAYFVAIGGPTWGDVLTILNRQGQIVDSLSDLRILSCPSWLSDEQTFYFRALTQADERAYIFRYSLPDEQLTVFYRLPDSLNGVDYPDYRIDYPAYGGSIGRLQVSPDGQFVASMGTERAIIIYPPEGERILVGQEYAEASDPLWFPPEQ